MTDRNNLNIVMPDQIEYQAIPGPSVRAINAPADVSDQTYQVHRARLIDAMAERGMDAVIVYADREHGGNFGYLTGYEPRFEEACLVVHRDGSAFVMQGNEGYKMYQYSRIKVSPIHTPVFSLPNQPMLGEQPLELDLNKAGIATGMKVGVVGWKLFTGKNATDLMMDVPHFIVAALREAVGDSGTLVNGTDIFIHPQYGIRVRVLWDEVAAYEYQATLASHCVLAALDDLEIGKSERELASHLSAYGQPISCTSMCATGQRFTNAVVYPRENKVKLGDTFTVSIGLRGGFTCRAGYVAGEVSDLPDGAKGYLEKVAIPYFAATATWYKSLRIGMTGGELYQAIETVLPKNIYGWSLNPGHLIATEEWMSTPIYPGSELALTSGMMLQMDIIPRVEGYGGSNSEDGVLLADEALRAEIQTNCPDVWSRMEARRAYMRDELGISLAPEVLPMSDTTGYLRPLLLNKAFAFRVR